MNKRLDRGNHSGSLGIESLKSQNIAVVGVPYDGASSFMQGPSGAPAAIREALRSPSSNMTAELGLDLGSCNQWLDIGDICFAGLDSPEETVETAVKQILGKSDRLVCLGGDHSITYPIVRALSSKYSDLTVLHLDAHPDLYHEFEGNRFSNACPFARIMEESLVSELVQVGIRTANAHQRDQAERFGVTMVEAKDFQPSSVPVMEGPVYLSVDMDVLDPAFAPGVSHYEPGGLTTRDVLTIIQAESGKLVGADIVELNPNRDPAGITAMVAAKFLKEILASILG